jgi:VanZ family protein
MPRHRSSAVVLAWLYAALIVYASLYPFAGWHGIGPSPLAFLVQPWSRWWSGFDLVSNLLGYMPLGAVLFGALVRTGWRLMPGVGLTLLSGALLSLAMELLQNFLPERVPSNVDMALNVLGTALGAATGAAVHMLGWVDRWQSVRDRWFIQRSAGGLALVILWPFGLLFPTPVPLGVGQVLGPLQESLASWLEGTGAANWAERWLLADPHFADLPPGSELAAVALGLMAPCVVGFAIATPGWRRAVTVLGAAFFGVVATTLSTALNFGPEHALAWRTPTVQAALGVGAGLALLVALLPRRVAAGIGLVVLTALVTLVTQAPEDPYFAQSLQAWEQGRFIRFHGAAQWVGWLWPYIAIAYLLARLGARDEA